jgi:F420H2 dehydrogenase subunit O
MADCELCTLAKPTLFPIKVQVHTLANPEGAYKGVCESCLSCLETAYQERFGPKPEKK